MLWLKKTLGPGILFASTAIGVEPEHCCPACGGHGMIKDSQKRKLLFLQPVSAGDVNTKEVLERLIQVLGQHGIKVVDDQKSENEIHIQRN